MRSSRSRRPDRDRLWAYRESPYEYGRFLPKLVGFDISIPLARMGEAVDALRADLARALARRLPRLFRPRGRQQHPRHRGDAEDDGRGQARGRARRSTTGSRPSGGSISAEHGIGRNKRAFLHLSRTEPELALMGMIKGALDPAGILNPDRVL